MSKVIFELKRTDSDNPKLKYTLIIEGDKSVFIIDENKKEKLLKIIKRELNK